MKIGINAQALTSAAPCGINTYIRNLLAAFDELDHDHDITLLASDPKQKAYGSFSYFGFSKLFNQSNCDLAFIPKESVPFFVKKPVIITVYDLFFLKMYREFKQQIKLSSKMHYELARLVSFKRADAICAISESCRQDLIELCGVDPKKITVTPLAYDTHMFVPRAQTDVEALLKKHHIEGPYFLNISSLFWEPKNVMGVLCAFKEVGEGELVMVGRVGPSFHQMQEYIHAHKLKVKCLIALPVEEVALLLAGARALVYPSFHEGFGLPIVEAMAVGCPVITSTTSAMPETAGGAAHLVDPHSCEEITVAMKKILEDEAYAEKLKQKGFTRARDFSWKKTAQTTLATLEAYA